MLKKIIQLIMIITGMMIALSILFLTFILAVIQTSERLSPDPVEKRYGIVIEQTYEGWSDYDDYYIIQFENGDRHEIESDDLSPGDEVTVWFYRDEPIKTLYGWR